MARLQPGDAIAMPPPAPSRQDDQARIVSATLYETGLLGVVERLLEGQTRKADIAADALSSPPGMRALALRRWSWATNAAARSRRSWLLTSCWCRNGTARASPVARSTAARAADQWPSSSARSSGWVS